jgi:murein DD-endopeptidase MepM/ murein hydrolase activator NlpD
MRVRFLITMLTAGMLIILGLPASVFARQDATPLPPPGLSIHVVQRGDTLGTIAESLGMTVDDLAQLNNIGDPSMIYIGQRLLIPANGGAPTAPLAVMHIVQAGESLESIARLYGLSVDELRQRNHLTDFRSFYVGALLDVTAPAVGEAVVTVTPPPPSEGAPGTGDTDASLTTQPSTPAAPNAPEAVIKHTVTSGETMFRIAMQYGIDVNDIVEANDIVDPQMIYIGQELIIPGLHPPKLALDLPAAVQGIDIAPLIFIEGQTGRIHLTTSSPMVVSGTFIDQKLNDSSDAAALEHTLLVGIPIGTAPDIYPLELTLMDEAGNQTPLPVNVQIISGGYLFESLQLMADRTNLLDPVTDQKELEQLRSITSNFTPTRYFDGPFGLPVAAPMSSHFGNTRSYNGGEFSRTHTGTDFAAVNGTPINAPAAGKVVFVGPLDIRGNVTIIDHGWGVFTVYCHQTQQNVRVGDIVQLGQMIGYTGSTGRVTGPHLHWEMWVDGVPVDAMQWVSQPFS